MSLNKSIEELENHVWEEREEYFSVTLKNCHDYRKIPLKDITIKQAVTLLQNDIGSEHLMPVVLDRMNADLYEEDPDDGSTFLEHIDGFSNEMFQRSSDLWKPMMAL